MKKVLCTTMTFEEEVETFKAYYNVEPKCFLCKEYDLTGNKVKNNFYCRECCGRMLEWTDSFINNLKLSDKLSNWRED